MTLLATFAQLHHISQVASWCYIPTINLTREEMSGKRLCERSLSATLGKFHVHFRVITATRFVIQRSKKSMFDCSKYCFYVLHIKLQHEKTYKPFGVACLHLCEEACCHLIITLNHAATQEDTLSFRWRKGVAMAV